MKKNGAYHNLYKILPKECCAICGDTAEQTVTKRLVYDHDHNTKFVRGVLCDLCNAWSAIYESKMTKATFLKDWLGYYFWVYCYLDKIKTHLKSNTGINYYTGILHPAFKRLS